MDKVVKVLHLTNGEDIIGVVLDKLNVVTIKKPARILIMPPQQPGGHPSVALAPWLQFSSEDTVTLKQEHIMYMVDPVNQLMANYQQMFADIITATKPSLIIP